MDIEAVNKAADYIRTLVPHPWKVLIILGSGLGPLAEEVQDAVRIPYHSIPGFCVSTAPGHVGQFVVGKIEGIHVGVMQGRMHFYEGHPLPQTTLPIRVARAMGAGVMIVTNAAGGINREFNVGDIMMIDDHINFLGMSGNNPLVGSNDEAIGPRFPQLTDAYDKVLRDKAIEIATAHGIIDTFKRGIFACQAGPFYETPAELRFFRLIGVDAVGMSTTNEVLVARHAGMRVVGFSSVTNVARLSADEGEPPSHEEVLQAASVVSPKLLAVVRGLVRAIGAE